VHTANQTRRQADTQNAQNEFQKRHKLQKLFKIHKDHHVTKSFTWHCKQLIS